MLCETDIASSWRARPRSFVALMGLYESNHLRFLRLVGDPARLSGTLTSRVAGDCELQLSVLGHMPYTSMFTLTYLLPTSTPGSGVAGYQRLPDLRLRAYHDASLLEAEELQPQHLPCAGRQIERELQQRWARNIMLNKWLEYCAERGHRFTGHQSVD